MTTLAELDAALENFRPAIAEVQAKYMAEQGRFLQGLWTHTQVPQTGAQDVPLAPDALHERPSDETEGWVERLPVEVPELWRASLKIDVYNSPQGWGYIIFAQTDADGVLYEKAIDEGPSGASREWGIVEA